MEELEKITQTNDEDKEKIQQKNSCDNKENKQNEQPEKTSKKKAQMIEESPVSSKQKIERNQETKRYKILEIYLLKSKTKLEELKDGKRIFNNRTECTGFENGYLTHFLEFKQLLYENLLFNKDLTSNREEKFTIKSAIFSTFCFDPEFIVPLVMRHRFKVKFKI